MVRKQFKNNIQIEIFKSVTLFERRIPALTFPSANPKMTSPGRSLGQTRAVTDEEAGNLLQMDFLSPHSVPIL